jgi:tetratricopeptide (TPR) repeat protein
VCSTETSPSATIRQVRLLIARNDFKKALELLNSEKTNDKSHAQRLYLRGYVLFRLERIDDAKRELQAALKVDQQSLQPRYILGRIAESERRPIEAIHWLEPCAEARPPVEDSPARIGKLYWDTGQTDKARVATEKAVAASPWDGGLHYRLARIYQQSGEVELARREFGESMKANAVDTQSVTKLMDCSQALASRDVTSALKIREEFLNARQLDPDLLIALGTTFATAGSPQQAVALFELAAAHDPKSFRAQFDFGLALLNLKQPVEAVPPLETSLRLVPESKEANAALALAYVMQGNFKRAIAPLEGAMQADPHDRKTAGLLSVAYYRSGDAAKAIPILRQSIKSSQDDPKFFFLLIDCLNATENQEEAVLVANEALERFPQLAQAWLGKAQQLTRLGRYHDAGPLFAKAAELAPQQVEPLLGLAEAQQKDGDYQAALETYRKAALRDRSVTALLGEARSLVYLGRLAEARTLLEQGVSQNSGDAQVHFELSRVYARMGEKQRAEEQTRLVQQLRAQNAQVDSKTQ